jgi:hypothetical protein
MAIAISVFESWERFLFILTGIILSTLAYFYFVMKLPTNHMQTNEKNFNLSLNWCVKNAIGNRQQSVYYREHVDLRHKAEQILRLSKQIKQDEACLRNQQ